MSAISTLPTLTVMHEARQMLLKSILRQQELLYDYNVESDAEFFEFP